MLQNLFPTPLLVWKCKEVKSSTVHTVLLICMPYWDICGEGIAEMCLQAPSILFICWTDLDLKNLFLPKRIRNPSLLFNQESAFYGLHYFCVFVLESGFKSKITKLRDNSTVAVIQGIHQCKQSTEAKTVLTPEDLIISHIAPYYC